jgi:hypothetical protein
MSPKDLHRLIDLLVAGDITPAEHEQLQSLLKADAKARATFRQRMDLESGLRNWAVETPGLSSNEGISIADRAVFRPPADSVDLSPSEGARHVKRWTTRQTTILAVLVASLIFVIAALSWNPRSNEQQTVDSQLSATYGNSAMEKALGQLVEQPDCRWQIKPVSWGGTFNSGTALLQQGAAELKFSSGTNLFLQAPCELKVTDASTAELFAGTVAVHVTEQSNGFVLETPESEILDEGTEYGVTVSPDSTEVHVFDGSVWWVPKLGDEQEREDFQDRIEAGQAKQYIRSEPAHGRFIPFGRRQFVWSIEQAVRDSTKGEIIAYDGFENLAGRIRRGRSGFGWSGGWFPSGQRRGSAAEIIDSPVGTVFGVNRDQRRLMLCSGGTDIRRELSPPFTWNQRAELYLSFIIRYAEAESSLTPASGQLQDKTPSRRGPEQDRSLRMTLEPDLPGRGRTRHAIASFGMTSSGVPFINSRQRVSRTGLSILPGEDYFCVVQFPSAKSNLPPRLRVYHSTETIEPEIPELWTVKADFPVDRNAIRWIRIKTGSDAVWHIDELRLGLSWQSVIEVEIDSGSGER